MKLLSFFTLFACVVALSNAAPIPSPGNDGKGKGKARATSPDPSEGSPSRPHTPTPAEDPNVPLPGRSGVHYDAHTGVSTAYYGDDNLAEHMGHVQRNQALHPGNRRPMPLASDAQHDHNRDEALHGIDYGGLYRNTGEAQVRDEKHIAMLKNEHHATTTTVERLPDGESHHEGGLTSSLKKDMEKHGSLGQIRPNPGWLPLDPHQRIAHEAPARLPHTQTFRPVDPNAPAPKKPSTKKDPAVAEAEAKRKAEGYTPTVGTSGMTLRHRVGVEPPPEPVIRTPRPDNGHTNLVPGRVSPPGHLWHPNTHGATHAGAPVPVTEAHTNSRQPPRPQNHDHYMQQQHQAHAAAQAAQQHPAPHHYTNLNNLAAFNAAHPPPHLPPHNPAHGPRRAAEAPGRLEHTPQPPHHNTPSTSQHGSQPHHPAPAPANQHHASGSGAKGKGKP